MEWQRATKIVLEYLATSDTSNALAIGIIEALKEICQYRCNRTENALDEIIKYLKERKVKREELDGLYQSAIDVLNKSIEFDDNLVKEQEAIAKTLGE